MSIDLSKLATAHRLLFAIPLKPVQGSRFQPTGFPGLGAATFRTADGDSLLVESAQSMANRFEVTVWDEAEHRLKPDLEGISHVTVTNAEGQFLTDSILEAHRLNSPYVLNAIKDNELFFETLGNRLDAFTTGAIDRRKLADTLLALDVSCLIHGLFLSANINKKTLAGGRLRVARALSAFIEADGVQVAASGGVKNDHVNPSGETKTGFGNVPFARDEFTAESVTLYVNLDLGQIRGYGLGAEVERLLIVLSLYKLRSLLDGNLRLRSACDLCVATTSITATSPLGFSLPDISALTAEMKSAIGVTREKMQVTRVAYCEKIEPKKSSDKEADEETDIEEQTAED
ncbi:type I-U CRISPR-associated RAMP protein Csb1/Cas7u [uncultured Thiodictyon sp.]|uniref:type I-G CRISPR-associated RAMP protein Csb1/Cas7g n=1 Tax=uncultured Thiodictyon sp. TaxID=1846217 RepID=UPI0025CB990F|nr:type I-U CRISPR-associated RAMP protein Csb1/Cas7u [uncultured Thiodictyon sp.]